MINNCTSVLIYSPFCFTLAKVHKKIIERQVDGNHKTHFSLNGETRREVLLGDDGKEMKGKKGIGKQKVGKETTLEDDLR